MEGAGVKARVGRDDEVGIRGDRGSGVYGDAASRASGNVRGGGRAHEFEGVEMYRTAPRGAFAMRANGVMHPGAGGASMGRGDGAPGALPFGGEGCGAGHKSRQPVKQREHLAGVREPSVDRRGGDSRLALA